MAAILGMQALVGSPAMAQQQDTSCAPFPERPGAGMVGAIDPPQGNGLRGGKDSGVPYTDDKYPNSPYRDHGYAGMVWHVYDPNCKQPLSISDPSITIDTWAGNELFNIGKNIVGATNSLHYTLYNGGVLGGLNQQIGAAANSIFDNIYMQLFSLFMLILAILMFRQIWKGDLAVGVSKRGLFALGGMWLAASTLVLVNNYDAIDRMIVDTTTGYPERLRGSQPRRRRSSTCCRTSCIPAWSTRTGCVASSASRMTPRRCSTVGISSTRRHGPVTTWSPATTRTTRRKPRSGPSTRRSTTTSARPRVTSPAPKAVAPGRGSWRSSSRWSTRCSSSSRSWPCCWPSCCSAFSRWPRR